MYTPPRNAPEVVVGSVWFAWGEHYEIKDERPGDRITVEGGDSYRERLVQLLPKDPKRARQFKHGGKWVADWRVAKYGEPSLAYKRDAA